ncbi:hypothetical protein GCM10010404_63660 [Nonomuraea africana]|uniref:LamG-like jellyroll fold domain-containing protein n=1 Tax=Nonomuraea africana TaxID=46171 RepID=A0ABR9KGN5_9ACTN|nr:LamG-like jellyroll fold domain-containing protein [Nonomuraea africana]MBE1561183.1 hypothetical protein [Nonomuraea africana]
MKVWANPDGKHLRAELFTQPVQLKNPGSGAWEPIDTRIVSRDGKLQATRVKSLLTFGSRGSKSLVSVTGEHGKTGLRVPKALPQPTISGNTITYPDAIAPGADLVVMAQANGFVSQVVIRRQPSGPITVRLPLTLPEGTKFDKTPQGLPQLENAKGEATAPPIVLTAMDATVEASPEEGKTSSVTARVETSGKTSELVFTPDAKFLADPAVTYPVTIAAPSSYIGGGVPTDAWVSKNDPNANHAGDGWLRAGTTQTSADINRVYLKFDTKQPELDGARVVDADLIVWNYKSGGPDGQLCGDPMGSGIVAERVVSEWSPYYLSWGNQPLRAGSPEGLNRAGYNYDASGTWCAKDDKLWHRVSGMARAWIEQGEENYGLVLRAANESPAINWRQYYAGEFGGGQPYPGYRHPPSLMIEYEPATVERKSLHWTESGAPRRTKPTPEEALALSKQFDSSFIDLGPMADELAQRLESNAAKPYFVGPTQLAPMPGEDWTTDVDPEMDEFDPEVTAVSPPEDSNDALPSTKISATFNEAVTGAVMEVKDAQGAVVAGTSAMDAENKILTFTPDKPLTPGVKYTAQASGARDGSTNRMDPYPWSFTISTLAAHWKLDEGMGSTAADSSGNGREAKLNDTASWVPGKTGQALTNTQAAQPQQQSRLRAATAAGTPVVSGLEIQPSRVTSGTTYSLSLTPTLKATATVDTGAASTVAFEVARYSDDVLVWSGSVSNVASGSQASIPVPAAKLLDGTRYEWRVKATAGAASSAWTAYQYFTTDAAPRVDQLQISPASSDTRGVVTSSLTPTLLARVTDQLGGPATASFEVARYSDDVVVWSGSVSNVASGSQASIPVPAAKLLDGTKYEWRVRASAGGATSPWTSYQYFTVDVPEAVLDGFQVTPSSTDTRGVVSSSLTPTLRARVTDPLGGPATVSFEVARYTDDVLVWSGSVSDVASGSQASIAVPAAKLLDGTKYEWRVKATTPGSTPAWTAYQFFTVDVPEATVSEFQVTPSSTDTRGVVSSSLTPTLRARVTDPLGGPATVSFEVARYTDDVLVWSGSVSDVASGSQASIAVPAAKLLDGTKYEWRVKATTPGSTPAWTAYQFFTVDVPEATVDQFQVSPAMVVGAEIVTSTLTPELRARITDPLGGAAAVEVQMADWATDTVRWSTTVASVPSGGQAVVTVPASILSDQVKYEFRVKATTPGSTPGWTAWQVFRVDLPNPATDPSVINPQVVPSQVVAEVTETSTLTPELRASVGHPQGSASRVEFEIEHDPGAPAGQGTGRIWSVAVDSVAAGSVAAAGVPAGTLANGWLVRWRVQAIVGTTTSGWSAWQALKINRPDSAPQVSELQAVPSGSIDGKTVTSTLTPELRTTVSDPRGEPLTAEFEVEHDPAAPEGQGSGPIWSQSVTGVAVGSQAAVAVPAGTLTDGWQVRWRVRATSPSAASAWSDWQGLVVEIPKPGVGDLQVTPSTVVDGGVVTDIVTPSLHATVTYAPGGTMKAEFEVEHDPDAPEGQGSGQIWSSAVEGLAAGTLASVTIPSGELNDGWLVRWRVRSHVSDLASTWSGWQKLRVDRPDSQPAISELQVTPASEVAGKLVTSTLTPTLRATVADPRGDSLTAEFELEHDPDAEQGSGQIWAGSVTDVAVGAQAVLAVPAGKLADEQVVRWRARAVSATAASAWSPWRQVTVDLPKPLVGKLAIAPLMSGTEKVTTRSLTPTLSATATHPKDAASAVEFVVEHDPAAPEGQGSGQIWTGSVDASPSGSEASVTVPANTLVEGWQIRWRVRATSGGLSSKWSAWQEAVAGLIEPGEEPLAQTKEPVVHTDQSFTVATWLRWNDKDGAYSVVEQKGAHQAPFRLGNDPEHGLVFTFTSADSADATVEGVRSGVEPPVGEWFHLAGVYDAAAKTATVHLNGNAIGTATLTFPAWDATRPMTVGSTMEGSIDEVRIHLKNLTPAEITGLQAPEPTSAPRTTPSASESAATTQAADDFKYEHMSLEECERGRDARTGGADIWNGGEGWDSISPYNGCWSRHLSFAIYERSTKYNKYCKCMLTTTAVEDYLNFDMTVVMHSYLGSADGLSVIGGAGTGLSPRDIKVWTRVDNFWTADDDFWSMLLGVGGTNPEDLYQSFKLQVDVDGGTNDCFKVFSSGDGGGLTRTGNLKKWMEDGDDVFTFHSAFGTGRASRCSIRPWMVYNDPVHQGDWDKIAVSAWGKPENDKSAGSPTVRCDSLSMGAKTAIYRGGCIFYGASRVYEMSTVDLENGAVARHIEMAYTRPQDTVPFKTDGPKHFPGKWPNGEPLSRITSVDSRYEANRKAVEAVCDEFFDDRPRKLTGEKDETKWEHCDEFPFKSTKQGAAFVHEKYGANNFSVKSILGSQNTSAGRHLNIFYARYRVLANDKFWVHIK